MLRLLSLLPTALQMAIYRRNVRFEAGEIAGLRAGIVASPEDALAAARLVHDSYLKKLVAKPLPSGAWVTRTQLFPATFVIVVKDGERVVGTISLQADTEIGLEMDCTFRDALAPLRAQGRLLAEVGALAVDPAYRRTGVFHLLNRTMFAVANAVGIADLVITVSSKAAPLYRAVLCFDELATASSYGKIDPNNPMTALRLPLDEAEARIRTQAPRSHAIYTERTWPEIALPPDLSPTSRATIDEARGSAVRALMRARPDVFRALSTREVKVLRRSMPRLSLPTPLQIDPHQVQRWVAQ